VASLRLKGIRGKKSTNNVGWEVPMRSHRSTSERWMECVWDNDLELSHLATVHTRLFLNGFPLANPTSDFIDFSMFVLLIITKKFVFYLLSLIPLVIRLCLSSQLGAESTIITSVFKDL
jgi:hypothetical protein